MRFMYLCWLKVSLFISQRFCILIGFVMHLYSSGYFCAFTPGNGANNIDDGRSEKYIGTHDSSSSCSEACKSEIQDNPSINGATFQETTSKCWCKIGMVQVIQTEQTFQEKFYTCKFTSKSSKVVLHSLAWTNNHVERFAKKVNGWIRCLTGFWLRLSIIQTDDWPNRKLVLMVKSE